MSVLTSRDNPRVRRWRALAGDARLRRREKRALIEGEHLVSACLDSGGEIEELILSKSGAARFGALVKRCAKPAIVLADPVFRSIVDVESPSGIAAEIALPRQPADLQHAPSALFLEGIQDSGNVGAILRSAAAFGMQYAVLGKGCADAWSPKVLRAGMGAHFSMVLAQGADLAEAIAAFGGNVACAVPRGGIPISQANLSGRVGWIFGSEGQGISAALADRAQFKVTIPMPGGAESLNVAAAAAICLYEAARRGH